jgi:hypothetical protein
MNAHLKLLKAVIRLLAFYFSVDLVLLLVNSPETLFLALGSSHLALPAAAMSRALSMCIRIFIYLFLALGLWVFAEPLARFFGKDLLKET